LHVRAAVSALVRSFVEIEPCPPKRRDEILDGPLDISAPVSVFDPENEDSTFLSGEEIVV
jgi:hypothetical protein